MKLRLSREAKILSAVLLAQAFVYYFVQRDEAPPPARALSELPAALGPWRLVQEGVVEEEVQEVLRADDILTRVYRAPGSQPVSLFIAYFRSQRTGQAPHSPKNCLPGSGWTPSESDTVEVSTPGRAAPLRVNRYVVQKGLERSVVLYWYQSQRRAIASEYLAKIHLVLDSLRYNRSDTALIRVVTPIVEENVEEADRAVIGFVQALYGPLSEFPQFRGT